MAEITLNVIKLVGGVITVGTGERNPAMTRLWWTTPRSGGMQSRDGGDYSDVAITGELTQSSINNIDGHSRTSVVAVEIGNTVTGIGGYAFQDCSGLTSVTIPNSVTSIGSYAFYYCPNLTSVTINGTPTIDFGAFADNPNLQEVWMESFQRDYVSIHGSTDWGLGLETANYTTWPVIAHCQDGLLVLNGGEGSSSGGEEQGTLSTFRTRGYGDYTYDITGTYNKYNDPHIWSDTTMDTYEIILGSHVTGIDSYGFSSQYCSVERITVPPSVSWIGTAAFQECTSLSEIWLPDFDRDFVSQQAIDWSLGIDQTGLTHTVICHCSDGLLILHGDAGSSSDGGEDEREHPYTRVIYQNGAATEDFNVSGTLSYSSLESTLGYMQNDITDVEVGTDVNTLEQGAFTWMISLQRVYIPSNIVNPMTQITSGVFDGSDNLEEVWFMGLTRDDVSAHALNWSLGENSMTYQTHPVICHCIDGLLVLHGDSGSSGSGS